MITERHWAKQLLATLSVETGDMMTSRFIYTHIYIYGGFVSDYSAES